MGRTSANRRRTRIAQANHRQRKLASLRKKYIKATGTSEKSALWQKVKNIAPWLKRETFLQPIPKRK